MRATGAGWAAGVGRVASILAPLAVPFLRDLGGTLTLFVVFAAFFGLAAISSFWLPERRGVALED